MEATHLAADASDVLLEQHGAKLGERLRRRVVQSAEDRFPFLYLEGEDAGAVPVSGLEAIGECLVVDQAGELENVGAGDGKPGEVHGGHSALPSLGLAGSAAGSDEDYTARGLA